jgi:putative copper export protein
MPLLGQVAPAVDGVRLSVHVLAASIWVGGQLTLAGLVPTARRIGPEAPRQIARAFARLSWPAFAVLVGTGVWNVVATHVHQSSPWQVLLAVKIAVAALAGTAALLHSRARTRRALALWGAVSGLASLAALVLGVFLAG